MIDSLYSLLTIKMLAEKWNIVITSKVNFVARQLGQKFISATEVALEMYHS